MIHKVLVANRGEIAVRIIRACRNLGIPTVAVYSESDAEALHVQLAEDAVCIGSAPASESYLNMTHILGAAEITGADAIHPGYGFLSENPEFARKCREQGITFIGPKAEVMEKMGNKSHARETMQAAGVPVIPGTESSVTDAREAKALADAIGYPVMIKASAGGGGKGMREVFRAEDFLAQFQVAQQETIRAFGDDEMYIEKLIVRPHHVEVQILGDSFGNVIDLGERDCSVQRNHQKLIEEAPSPFLDEETRQKMREVAVLAGKTVGYENAGTIEFIVDQNRNFYFMEMNTRIQVEHPVTEFVTGVDIVEMQLKIADGEEIPEKMRALPLRGHAIECRINAEDPQRRFRPSPGQIGYTHFPAGNGIRVDTGIYDDYHIPSDYDSMIAKIIAYGPDRDSAIRRMIAALDETVITGIRTNLDFQYLLLQDARFQAGGVDTSFIEEYLTEMRSGEYFGGVKKVE